MEREDAPEKMSALFLNQFLYCPRVCDKINEEKGGFDIFGLDLESLPSLVSETVSGLANTRLGEVYSRTRLNCTPLHARPQWMGESGSLKQICYVRPGLNREVPILGLL